MSGRLGEMARKVPRGLRKLWWTAGVLAENARGARSPTHSVAVLDDLFPSPLSGFRMAEYGTYLQAFRDAVVYTSAATQIGEYRSYAELVADYAREWPELAPRVLRHHSLRRLRARLGYTMFLNNAVGFVDAFDRSRVPFVFTLYPGGGFRLDDPASDRKLERVLGSPWCRRVIATQTITRDYLERRGLCRAEHVAFIYGCPLPPGGCGDVPAERPRFGMGKPTLDICFVAHRYMPGGADKGYDVFCAAARAIGGAVPEARFHVVGGFDSSDGDLAALGERVRFQGPRESAFLAPFYAGMDLILSPNAPSLLGPGAFDGFPTASCMEAGRAGVAVFCTDPLGLNVAFEDGREIVLIGRDADAIAEQVLAYRGCPERLAAIGAAGMAAFRRAFGADAQIAPRIRLLTEELN
ncbi:MAG: glycosyltransferase family 4 protein [Chthonomonadales bacterium]|nr:glycosyltransferase family 4 protein [Chthonomonadales bacterium]